MTDVNRTIREARPTDMAEIMKVMEAAKGIMRSSGNMHHRIASYPDAHGIFGSIMDFCFSKDPNIRIDTHRDNTIMQHVMTKYGFTYCGIIYLASGDDRLAYQRIL